MNTSNNLCEETNNNHSWVIIYFLIGFILYQIFGEFLIKQNREERERKLKKCAKYFEKHRKENEDFFFGESAIDE